MDGLVFLETGSMKTEPTYCMNQDESLLDVLALLYKWRKSLIGLTLLSMIAAAAVSLTLPNYYQAHTYFYAASPDLAQPNPVGTSAAKQKIFGTNADLDRLFSIARSNEVMQFLTEKFDLISHYEIDPQSPKAQHKLQIKLNKLYTTQKTKYDAIDLAIEDKDPALAAAMANAARNKTSELSQQLIKKSQIKLINNYKSGIKEKQNESQELSDSLFRLRTKFDIFSTDTQGEALGSSLVKIKGEHLKNESIYNFLKTSNAPADSVSRAKAKFISSGKQLSSLEKSVKKFSEGHPQVKSLERKIRDFSAMMNYDKEKLAQLEAVYESNISSIHVIEEAVAPVIKSRPKRSILVLGVGFLTFVLMSLFLIVKKQLDNRNWREQFRNA